MATELMLSGEQDSICDLLQPDYWSHVENKNIDQFCSDFIRTADRLILSNSQPGLAALLDTGGGRASAHLLVVGSKGLEARRAKP